MDEKSIACRVLFNINCLFNFCGTEVEVDQKSIALKGTLQYKLQSTVQHLLFQFPWSRG